MLVETSEYFPSSPLFHEALVELSDRDGHEIAFVDEAAYKKALEDTAVHKLFYRLSRRRPLRYWPLNAGLVERAKEFRPDVVLVVKGAFINARTLQEIKRMGTYLVNFATDDPFNRVVNTPVLLQALPHYDLVVTTKTATISDIHRLTGGDVVFVAFGYKPMFHFPEPVPTGSESRFECDVAFIGGSDPDRIPYFRYMLESIPSLELGLYGGGWDRVPSLRTRHRGFAIGDDFRFAVAGAKICVNLVRKANRDGHVMRSFEIPACGGFMLAERTSEHRRFFTEDDEAAFFEGPSELVSQVERFLGDARARRDIAERGRERVVSGGNTYMDRLEEILGLIESR